MENKWLIVYQGTIVQYRSDYKKSEYNNKLVLVTGKKDSVNTSLRDSYLCVSDGTSLVEIPIPATYIQNIQVGADGMLYGKTDGILKFMQANGINISFIDGAVTVGIDDATLAKINSIDNKVGKGDLKSLTYKVNGVSQTFNGLSEATIPQIFTPTQTGSQGQLLQSMGGGAPQWANLSDIKETIGFAKDLTGVLEATPEEFTFRPSAGDKSIRDESAVIRRIKGNTTVWGQLADITQVSNTGARYIMETGDGWFSIQRDLSNTGTPYCYVNMVKQYAIPTHKYLFSQEIEVSGIVTSDDYCSAAAYNFTPYSGVNYTQNGKYSYTKILTKLDDTTFQFFYYAYGHAKLKVSNLQCFDLTSLFGDGNEPTTIEEFKAIYPDIYPYCEPELRTMRTTAIETVGFNLFNGEYADLIGGKTYYIGGTDIGILTFTPKGTTASEVIELGDDRTYTPISSGKISSTGTDICVHFQHSGIKDGECADYVEHMLELPEIAKYFPDGMNGIGKVYDEINADNAIQRCGVRAYEDGDENDPNVITDRTNTVYQLAEPIVKPIIEPIQLAYDVEDFGTERAISPEDSAPFRADIVYQFNAEGRIRDNGRNIDKLELQVNTLDVVTKSIATRFVGEIVIADGLVDGEGNHFWLPSTRTIDHANMLASAQFVIDNIPTEAATATPLQSFSYISEIGSMAPNVMYECAKGLGETLSFELPPLNQPSSGYDHSWMIRFPSIENSNILTYPYPIKWKDGTPPTFVNSCTLEIYLKKTGAGEIIGEWKIYR